MNLSNYLALTKFMSEETKVQNGVLPTYIQIKRKINVIYAEHIET